MKFEADRGGGSGGRGVGGGKGGAYLCVACLSHLTIDHAPLWGRSTIPDPKRHLQRLGAHYTFSIFHGHFVLRIPFRGREEGRAGQDKTCRVRLQ